MQNRAAAGAVTVLLVLLEVFVVVGALQGSVSFIRDPSGAGLGMKPEWLAGTPFRDYLVPGVILLIAVGGSMAAAVIAHLLRVRRAAQLAVAAGGILTFWIAVQVAMGVPYFFLQPVLFGTGAAIVVLGALRCKLQPRAG